MVVYRIVDNDPPAPSDFMSLVELNPTRNYKMMHCQASGVSVLTDYDEAVALAESIWQKRRKEKSGSSIQPMVACGQTDPSCGVHKRTPSNANTSHVTYWLRVNVNAEGHFKVV